MMIVHFIRQLTKPDLKATPNNIEHNILWNRNQNVLRFLLIQSFLFLAYNIIMGSHMTMYSMVNFGFFFIVILTFVCNCRSDPGIFNFLYPFLGGLYGILQTFFAPERIFETWITAMLSPLFFMTVTGNYICLFFGCISQVGLMCLYYNQKLEEKLKMMEVKEMVDSLVSVCLTRMLMALFLILIQQEVLQSLKTSYFTYISTKEAELERKKCFIEAFFTEVKDIIQGFSNNIHFALQNDVPQKVKDELATSKTGIDLLLHIVENFLTRGSGIICDFDINPTFTQVYSCLEKTWNLCIETLKAKGIRGTLRIEKKCPGIIKIDNYRLFQIILNLVGHSLKTSRHGTVAINIKWIKGASKVTKETFEPLPYEEDGIYEKDMMIEALNRKHGEDDYYTLTFEKTKFAEAAILDKRKSSSGVIKIIYTDTGCEGWHSIPFSNNYSVVGGTPDEFSLSKIKKSIGLFMIKEICKHMGGDIKAFVKSGKGLAFVICIPISE